MEITPQEKAAHEPSIPPLVEFRWIDFGGWFIRRNPLYLLSAVAMALAARLLLVDPGTRAGDLSHILLTLGVLQLYEIVATGLLLILFQFRRSPEDRPSLLLVGTIFWTAPLAAATELTAQHGVIGISLSLAVGILAAAELEIVLRRMRLPISNAGRAAALAQLALIALLPGLLRRSDALALSSERALLVGWWLLAGVLIVTAGAARAASLRLERSVSSDAGTGSSSQALLAARIEVLWLVLLVVIAGAQLTGMNHAFFLHATMAYAAPGLILLAVVLIESRPMFRSAEGLALFGMLVLPALALFHAEQGYDAKFVRPVLPLQLARPLVSCGLLAGLVWWLAWRRGCGVLFLHLGTGAIVLAAAALLAATAAPNADAPLPAPNVTSNRDAYALGAFAAAVYFAITAIARRCRPEAVLAVAMLAAGVVLATWRVVPADRAIAASTIYWFWFIALHIAIVRPTVRQLASCLAFGLLVVLAFGAYEPSLAAIWLHAAAVPLVFFALAYLLRRREYAILGSAAAGVPICYLGIRSVSHVRPSPAAFAAVSAFALLVAGGCVSWFKTGRAAALHEADRPAGNTL